jgi:hypothetical protein
VIDVQRYLRALEAKGAVKPCEACGTNAWGPARGGVFLPGFEDKEKITLGPGFVAIAIICTNCGLVRIHHMPQLESGRGSVGEAPSEEQQENPAG